MNFWGHFYTLLHKVGNISESVNLMKDVIDEIYVVHIYSICLVLDQYHLFFHFQKFVHGFQVGPKYGIFRKCSK